MERSATNRIAGTEAEFNLGAGRETGQQVAYERWTQNVRQHLQSARHHVRAEGENAWLNSGQNASSFNRVATTQPGTNQAPQTNRKHEEPAPELNMEPSWAARSNAALARVQREWQAAKAQLEAQRTNDQAEQGRANTFDRVRQHDRER